MTKIPHQLVFSAIINMGMFFFLSCTLLLAINVVSFQRLLVFVSCTAREDPRKQNNTTNKKKDNGDLDRSFIFNERFINN
jgi:hypothetical protein